ncbi:MAG: AMP-binding protein, partial [Spirochaetia bacterium]
MSRATISRQVVAVAVEALVREAPYIAFETSGTTGQPKRVKTSLSLLDQEIEHLATVFGGSKRIVSTVKARHIYGFLFTAMLPSKLGVARVEPGAQAMSFWRDHVSSGDLVVSFPDYLRFIADLNVRFPENVSVVTSTAPCLPEIWGRMRECGVSAMSEVYGSTETGGIGIRDSSDAPFLLFPYYEGTPEGTGLLRTLPDRQVRPLPLMDRLLWSGPRRVTPVGRSDGAINIGGEKVHMAHVESIIEAHPHVQGVEVRLNAAGDRLTARVR